MAIVSVSCEYCSKVMPVEEAVFNVGNQAYYCKLHDAEVELADINYRLIQANGKKSKIEEEIKNLNKQKEEKEAFIKSQSAT